LKSQTQSDFCCVLNKAKKKKMVEKGFIIRKKAVYFQNNKARK
jgi:hypothetical protein